VLKVAIARARGTCVCVFVVFVCVYPGVRVYTVLRGSVFVCVYPGVRVYGSSNLGIQRNLLGSSIEV
jgi:hypothetical protein